MHSYSIMYVPCDYWCRHRIFLEHNIKQMGGWLPYYCSSEIPLQHLAPKMNSSLQSQEQVHTPWVEWFLFLLEKLLVFWKIKWCLVKSCNISLNFSRKSSKNSSLSSSWLLSVLTYCLNFMLSSGEYCCNNCLEYI